MSVEAHSQSWLRGRVGTRLAPASRELDFDGLYAREAEPLLAFLFFRTADRGLAEDLLADTFERVLRKRRSFDPRRGTEKAWLYTIALNALRDHGRRRASERRAVERVARRREPDRLDTRLTAVEDRDLMSRAMACLSEEEREAVSLRFGADLTMAEMAELLGQPVTTVEARVYRALRKLRERIDE